MKRLITAATTLLLITPFPLLATPEASSSSQCNATLRAVNRKANTGLPYHRFPANSGHPQNRPTLLSFVIGSSGGSSIMNSSRTMQSISSDIINHCSDVSAVEFIFNQSDWGEVFGLIGGKVKKFKCFGTGEPYPGWGYYECL